MGPAPLAHPVEADEIVEQARTVGRAWPGSRWGMEVVILLSVWTDLETDTFL